MTHRSGLELARMLHDDVLRSLWQQEFPALDYAAGLIGRGSEVLGYDDAMSTDHSWAARLTIMVADDQDPEPVGARLSRALPEQVDGVPVEVAVTTPARWLQTQLTLAAGDRWDAADWLSLSEHRLRTVTAGTLLHDGVGLTALRDRLGYYPHDVWLYLLAAGWWRVHPELNLVGRTGFVGDDLGSRLIAAEITDALIRLCFLIERRYAPYRKWFGTAFGELRIAARLSPVLAAVLRAEDVATRERELGTAYTLVAEAFAGLGVVPALELAPVRLWDRPFAVPWADFPTALIAAVTDPQVRRIAERWPIGSVTGLREQLWHTGDRTAVRDLIRTAG